MNGAKLFTALVVVTLTFISSASAETITGTARIIDGDTLEIGGEAIRLFGLDAPETRQTCTSYSGRDYPCGVYASDALADLVQESILTCVGTQRDRYDRLIASCSIGALDLNREMVRIGWAVAFKKYTTFYLAEELEAAKSSVGLWRGEFQRPSEFRAAIWAASEQKSPAGCPIKGNISKRGKIYHAPWSRSYDRTRINPARGERWFCSEAEAIAAGWRAPLR